MEVKRKENLKKLIVIEYPAKVENVDKMVESLGGVEDLSKGFEQKQKLQLRFRQNFFAKPVVSSEPQEQTGMLLNVKVRKSKRHPEKSPEVVSMAIFGTVGRGYKFNSFCDFQYLPIQRNEKTGQTENIYHDSVPGDINVGPSWFREKPDAQIFLPPFSFTRSDTTQPTILKNEPKDVINDESANFAITNRTSRATNGIAVAFSLSDPIPTTPNEAVKDIVTSNLVTQEDFELVQNLFKERKIWTLASLRAHMRSPPRRLNFILASIAFYYSTGPWRNCFVQFGYDPRRNFDSRVYQMLDFRVRAGAGLKCNINSRRQFGVNKRVKVLTKYESGIPKDEELERKFQKQRKEAIFDPETIPPFRARHYQFVDIHIPKIQEMLQKIPTPISGVLCNEKRGWLPGRFIEECRDTLSEIAQSNMLNLCKEKNMTFDEFSRKSETSVHDDGSESDEAETQFPEDVEINEDDY